MQELGPEDDNPESRIAAAERAKTQANATYKLGTHLFNHSSTGITRIYLDITREEVVDLYDINSLFTY